MTTTYHTPIATGAAANAATFNNPLASLDAELVSQDSRVDVLEAHEIVYSEVAEEFLNGVGDFAVPSGTGGTNGHVIQSEGVDKTQRTKLNFTGNGVTVTDGVAGTAVDIPGITPSDADPQANGTAAPGTSANYSRADHVHPGSSSLDILQCQVFN